MTDEYTKQNRASQVKLSLFLKTWIATLAILTIILGIYHSNESSKVAEQLTEQYLLPLDMAYGLQCYKGTLHYPNQGNFSGLLPVTPRIQCSLEDFEAKSHNKYSIWFGISLLSTLFNLLIIWLVKSP
ncbi:hypothetical protein [Thiomicrorhabdus sp. Milos-T2]|uniref:hypothetical protein n=1 Tax=Thiomicrorhabdus sp. Milos-T2 TaxID=90814 RepID=UPI0004948AD8|nr:hypothetical protein [Thiomicrorhabdus sp. Milos-T2]